MTTLNNSFCRPTNEEVCQIMTPLAISADENHVLIAFTVDGKNYKFYRRWEDVKDDNRTEIPVTHFLDLYHDNIIPWRLEEVGFRTHPSWPNIFDLDIDEQTIAVSFRNNKIEVEAITDEDSPLCLHILTFTELLTLIRMLTPPLT